MPVSPYIPDTYRYAERGNILFIILMAVVLIGLLTAAIQATNRPEGATIDKEALIIRATEVQRYASELERGITYIMQNGKSESDIRFSHPDAHSAYGDLSADPDKSDQLFDVAGGGAAYRAPPSDINDGSAWEFYGGTHIPGMGTDRPDLVAVLPNVTAQFCARINEINNQTGTPADTGAATASGLSAGDCVHIGNDGRFNDTQQFYDTPTNTPNDMDETSFEQDPNTTEARPAPQACVQCTVGPANHFYHVLLVR